MARNQTTKSSPSSSSSRATTRSKAVLTDWPSFYEHEAALIRAKTPNANGKVIMKRVSSKWRKQKAELEKEEKAKEA